MAPTPAVFRDRHNQVQAALAASGLDGLLVAGRGAIAQNGYLIYVTGYCPVARFGVALILHGRAPTLIVPTESDLWLAGRSAATEDIVVASRFCGPSDPTGFAGAIRSRLGEGGSPSMRIGIVGLEEIVPAAEAERWLSANSSINFTPATAVLTGVKTIKTPADIEGMRATAAIADGGLRALVVALQAGGTAREAAAAAEAHVRARGACEILVYASEHPHFLHRPSDRALAPRGMMTAFVEISDASGYWVELARVIARGAPSTSQRRLFETCDRTLAVSSDLMKPGVPVGVVAAEIDRVIADGGLTSGLWYGHGVGVDHDTPTIGRSSNEILEAGMVIALHPHLVDPAAGEGASLCDTFAVGPNGAVPLSALSRDLIILDP